MSTYHSGPRRCACGRPTETDQDSDGFVAHYPTCGDPACQERLRREQIDEERKAHASLDVLAFKLRAEMRHWRAP